MFYVNNISAAFKDINISKDFLQLKVSLNFIFIIR